MKPYGDYALRLDALFATRHLFRDAWHQSREQSLHGDRGLDRDLNYEADRILSNCEEVLGKEVCEHFRNIYRSIARGAGNSYERFNEVFGPVDAEICEVLRELSADRTVFEEKAA